MVEQIPEIEDLYYDFKTGNFKTKSDENPVSAGDIQALSAYTGGRSESGAGSKTIKRAVVTHTLLQTKGRKGRNGILESLTGKRGSGGSGGLDSDLKGVLYSRGKTKKIDASFIGNIKSMAKQQRWGALTLRQITEVLWEQIPTFKIPSLIIWLFR